MTDGSLAVGTGRHWKALSSLRQRERSLKVSLLVSTNQTHVISLTVTAKGELIAGTDSGGLVCAYRLKERRSRCLIRSCGRIHALAPAADGSIYALALSDAAAPTRAAPAAPCTRAVDERRTNAHDFSHHHRNPTRVDSQFRISSRPRRVATM
jgi:hypothetical protein